MNPAPPQTRRSLRRSVLHRYLTATLAAVSATASAGEPPAPPPDVVRTEVLAAGDRVTSVETTYTAVPVKNIPDATNSRHHVAQKGRLRYAENTHFTDRTGPEADLNHTRMYFTGRTFDVFYVKTRYYETSVRNATLAYPWKLRVDTLLAAAGWWPKDDDAPPDDAAVAPFRPLRFVVTDPACTFTGGQLDGEPCVVVGRPGRERVWLDPNRGWAVRRFEATHRKTGAVALRTTASEFARHALPGGDVWFPARIRVEGFEGPAEAALVRETELRVEKIAFNAVTDDRFVFRPPPGTLIQDRDSLAMSHVPGGRELLDEAVVTIRAVTGPPAAAPRGLSRSAAWGLIAAAAVVPFGLGVVVTRWPGRRIRPGTPCDGM